MAAEVLAMPSRKGEDGKRAALQRQGTLNPRPQNVTDPLFQQHVFFDARDLVQVKYEMLRRVRLDKASVSQSATAFGFSRPSYYQAQKAFARDGLPGLIPKKRGPHGAHKLNPEILGFVLEAQGKEPTPRFGELTRMIEQRFGVSVHPRSVERAFLRRKKTA
jgi:transposase